MYQRTTSRYSAPSNTEDDMQHSDTEPDAFFAVIHNSNILGVSDRSAEDARQDAIASAHGMHLYRSIVDAKLTRSPDMGADGVFVAEMTETAHTLFVDSDGDISEGYVVRDGLVDVGGERPVEPVVMFESCESCGREHHPQRGYRTGLCGSCSAVVGLRFMGWPR